MLYPIAIEIGVANHAYSVVMPSVLDANSMCYPAL
ncbi:MULTISPECIES: type II toxin-antitoxin system HicB family antitoxin [Xenorhabdus]|nr:MULTISPECIES: type II toxin-antitoxin system HicB family antitoxin [Xenorhabdus]